MSIEKPRLNVTVVDSDVSYPTNSGKRLRTINLLLPLARRHNITYIGRSTNGADEAVAKVFFDTHGIETVFVREPLAKKVGPRFLMDLSRNLLSPLPFSVASHFSTAMRAAVTRHAASSRVDVIQLEHLSYLYTTNGLPAPIVLQAHNVESLIWKRYAETERSPLKKAYIGEQFRKYLKFERAAFERVQRVVCVSGPDERLARQLYGEHIPTTIVDNGVDIENFAGLSSLEGSKKVIFLGAFDWRPNVDAVDNFLSNIFPRLREMVPDAEASIVGRRAPLALAQRIAGTPGATLHSDVPDVRPYLSASAAMTVPLRIAGGSRLKILESLAAGLPVVTTTIGAEGLDVVDARDVLIADHPDAHARHLAAVISQPALYRPMIAAGRQKVVDQYSWAMLAARLEQTWEEVALATAGSGPAKSR